MTRTIKIDFTYYTELVSDRFRELEKEGRLSIPAASLEETFMSWLGNLADSNVLMPPAKDLVDDFVLDGDFVSIGVLTRQWRESHADQAESDVSFYYFCKDKVKLWGEKFALRFDDNGIASRMDELDNLANEVSNVDNN